MLVTISNSMGAWLQAVKGVPDIEEGINPATWMLEVSSVGSESRMGVNFAEVYEDSKFAKYAPAAAAVWLEHVCCCSTALQRAHVMPRVFLEHCLLESAPQSWSISCTGDVLFQDRASDL